MNKIISGFRFKFTLHSFSGKYLIHSFQFQHSKQYQFINMHLDHKLCNHVVKLNSQIFYKTINVVNYVIKLYIK